MRAPFWTDLSTTEIRVNENRGLTGKLAIVFGGSRGIGAATAKRLAREGADVAVTYVSAQEQAVKTVMAIEATGGLALQSRLTAQIRKRSRQLSRRPWITSGNWILRLSTPASCF
jgi:short subunit dehydrogenase